MCQASRTDLHLEQAWPNDLSGWPIVWSCSQTRVKGVGRISCDNCRDPLSGFLPDKVGWSPHHACRAAVATIPRACGTNTADHCSEKLIMRTDQLIPDTWVMNPGRIESDRFAHPHPAAGAYDVVPTGTTMRAIRALVETDLAGHPTPVTGASPGLSTTSRPYRKDANAAIDKVALAWNAHCRFVHWTSSPANSGLVTPLRDRVRGTAMLRRARLFPSATPGRQGPMDNTDPDSLLPFASNLGSSGSPRRLGLLRRRSLPHRHGTATVNRRSQTFCRCSNTRLDKNFEYCAAQQYWL